MVLTLNQSTSSTVPLPQGWPEADDSDKERETASI